jgi:hypothetical protein
VERSGIGAAVRLGRSFEFLNDLHLFKVQPHRSCRRERSMCRTS